MLRCDCLDLSDGMCSYCTDRAEQKFWEEENYLTHQSIQYINHQIENDPSLSRRNKELDELFPVLMDIASRTQSVYVQQLIAQFRIVLAEKTAGENRWHSKSRWNIG